MTSTHRGPEHQTICDQTTLGWTALRVEEEKGPDLCVTVSELRSAREVYRDLPHPKFPKCECQRIQLATITREIRTARLRAESTNDAHAVLAYHDLLDERRGLREAWGVVQR